MYILNPFVCDAQTNEVCPQVLHLGAGYRRDAPDSLTGIVSNRPLDFVPKLRAFHLKPETNLTDVVSQGYIYTLGLLASPAFRAALEGFSLQAHEDYPAAVVHHGREHAYRYLHFAEELESRIDYARSEFAVRRPGGEEEPVRLADPEDLRRLCRRLVETGDDQLRVLHVAFRSGTPAYDLFGLLLTSHVYFASDPLSEELTRRRLTGFELQPTASRFTFDR